MRPGVGAMSGNRDVYGKHLACRLSRVPMGEFIFLDSYHKRKTCADNVFRYRNVHHWRAWRSNTRQRKCSARASSQVEPPRCLPR